VFYGGYYYSPSKCVSSGQAIFDFLFVIGEDRFKQEEMTKATWQMENHFNKQ